MSIADVLEGIIRLKDFYMKVSNSSNTEDEATVCVFHQGSIPGGGAAYLQCNPPVQGRYVTILNSRNVQSYWYFAVCEVVVIGYKAIGKFSFFV